MNSSHDPLKDLIASDDFVEIERSVASFNLFRVLRCADYEIRHSNVLAWLLDPTETHGAGDSFLRSFLEEAGLTVQTPIRLARVRREWRNIDILVELHTSREIFVICVENKIYAKQGKNQLTRYREDVEKLHEGAKHVFIFLTLRKEKPRDSQFVSVSYDQVASMLRSVLKLSLSMEPSILITNYLDVIEAKLEEGHRESRIERLCKAHPQAVDVLVQSIDKIGGTQSLRPFRDFEAHHSALDVILRYRPNRHTEIANLVKKWIDSESAKRGWKRAHDDSRIVRFVPKAWQSFQGRAKLPRLFVAIHLAEELPHLRFVASDDAPSEWKEAIAKRSLNWSLPGVISEARKRSGKYGFYIEPLPDIRELPSNEEAGVRIWQAFLAAMDRNEIESLVDEVARLVTRV